MMKQIRKRFIGIALLALTLAIWVLAPGVDECIQLTTPGRAGMFSDVLIDMAGGLTGHLLCRLVQHIKNHRK